MHVRFRVLFVVAAIFAGTFDFSSVQAGSPADPARGWLDGTRSPEQRARLLAKQLTQSEKILLIQGENFGATAGKLADFTRFGLPILLEADAPLGITNLNRLEPGTVMPAAIATAATWNAPLARQRGEVLAEEARNQGIGVLLYPAGNLVRDPRGGRTGEYFGEDPLLSGELMAASVEGIQSRHVLATVKHLGIYGWESQRKTVDFHISDAAARESDLLAFEIAIERGRPASVMCAYGWYNGIPSCSNRFLLTDVLRRSWGYDGFAMTDWDAFQDTVVTANAGLDMQSGILPTTNPKPGADRRKFPGGGFNDGRMAPPPVPFGPGSSKPYYGKLQDAIDAGKVSQAALDRMVRNILRSIFATGVVDHPPVTAPVGGDAHKAVAQIQEEEGAVLLKNDGEVLPLSQNGRLALIGKAAPRPGGANPSGPSLREALEARYPGNIRYSDGVDPAEAASVAGAADAAIVVVRFGGFEGLDLASLSLSAATDALIEKVAAANPRTVVLVYGTNPILMPWLANVAGVMQVWDPGDDGAVAIVRLLSGEANPSGRLPLTYPAAISQLPQPEIPGFNRGGLGGIYSELTSVDLKEGAAVGYKWFDRQKLRPLFPFGFGLSYTEFSYSKPQIRRASDSWTISVGVTNKGARDGKDVVQLYGRPPGGLKRLIGFEKIDLKAGASRQVMLTIDPRMIASWDVRHNCWHIPTGSYEFILGKDAATSVSVETLQIQREIACVRVTR